MNGNLPVVSDPDQFLLSVDRVKASGAPRLSSQSVEPTFTTASASSGAVQQLPEEAAGSLETGDIAEASSELDATQEPTMVVDDDIKAYLSPRQDAISGPHSPNPRDAISGSLSSLSKDAAGMTTSPHPQVAASKPHSPMPMSAVLSRPNLLLKDAVLGSLSPLPMGDEKQKAGMEQRVATPPRRERLQGNWSTVCTQQTCIPSSSSCACLFVAQHALEKHPESNAVMLLLSLSQWCTNAAQSSLHVGYGMAAPRQHVAACC